MDAESPVRLDVAARLAWQHGNPIDLPRRCFEYLAYLAARPGQVVTRDELMREVWGQTWGGATKTLDMHTSWLRRKLGDDPAKPNYITTVRGVGFRLEPDMVELVWPSVDGPVTGPDTSLTRVVLVKPGDVLVFGNVGKLSERVEATASTLSHQLGLRKVVLFEDDIDMTALPGGAL